MRQNTWCGYFAIDRTQMVEVVTWKAQYRDTKCWGLLELWLSLNFTQHRQKNIKSLLALKLGITVSYIIYMRHAFQTCNVFW